MRKGKGAKRGRPKKGGKAESKVDKESEAERAKANAALWEARLEVTEISRAEYREAARTLARNNEELAWQQHRLEKDTVEVISFLKKQDVEKEEQIAKLKQQLADLKQQAQEENEKVAEHYSVQLKDLEEKFSKKAREIGLIQLELKTIKEFRKKKAHMEKELEDIKENMRISNREHQETLGRLENRFIEEKQLLEREAEKKIVMLAERAHHEAIVQLDSTGRAVFKENVRLQEALAYHLKETEELKKIKKQLEEDRAFLLQEKETNESLVQEKVRQVTLQKAQIQALQHKVERLEMALGHMTQEFETEIQKTRHQALVENQAGMVEINKLQQLLEMKDREMNRVKKLAKNILDERSEVESFFLEALDQVKREIVSSRKCYKQVAQAAYQKKMMEAFAGKEEYPKIRTFNNNAYSTNSVYKDLQEAEKWTNIQQGKVDIGQLTWEQKECVLRLLFARMNGRERRKGKHVLVPSAPAAITPSSEERNKTSTENIAPSLTFITQQFPVSEPSSHGAILPDIEMVTSQTAQ
ncbi:basal body-orientation factor 1 isoform X2 [Malaclemys terrapin pileata]|uniref:basal body-orientation factor 1 isoform X2 n=1 Tax=Malaclemys terrapin pileata TaxID=2991368 RepID=UPI0023A7FF04|nr:basal body-orientation factor 1 isoform X2 [Malaclemys terrapin pileata]